MKRSGSMPKGLPIFRSTLANSQYFSTHVPRKSSMSYVTVLTLPTMLGVGFSTMDSGGLNLLSFTLFFASVLLRGFFFLYDARANAKSSAGVVRPRGKYVLPVHQSCFFSPPWLKSSTRTNPETLPGTGPAILRQANPSCYTPEQRLGVSLLCIRLLLRIAWL